MSGFGTFRTCGVGLNGAIVPKRLCGPRAACSVLPQALLPLRIRLGAAPARICRLGLRIGLEKEAEEAVALNAAARDDIDRGLARHEAALRLSAQDRDELGAIIGLAAQWLRPDCDPG